METREPGVAFHQVFGPKILYLNSGTRKAVNGLERSRFGSRVSPESPARLCHHLVAVTLWHVPHVSILIYGWAPQSKLMSHAIRSVPVAVLQGSHPKPLSGGQSGRGGGCALPSSSVACGSCSQTFRSLPAFPELVLELASCRLFWVEVTSFGQSSQLRSIDNENICTFFLSS